MMETTAKRIELHIDSLLDFIKMTKSVMTNDKKTYLSYFINLEIAIISSFMAIVYNSYTISNMILVILIGIALNIITHSLFEDYAKYNDLIDKDIQFLELCSRKTSGEIEQLLEAVGSIKGHNFKFLHLLDHVKQYLFISVFLRIIGLMCPIVIVISVLFVF
jgi:hypothetical protein